jgi:hypothetical protein
VALPQLGLLVVKARDHVAHERRQILAPLAQRRDADRDDGEPLVEVGAEETARDEGEEVAVGGREDAEVHLAPIVLAEPAHHAVLEDAQQLDLERGGRVVHLVEEHRAASAAASSPS